MDIRTGFSHSKNGAAMSQATAERRKQIMSQLLEHKQVTVKELAAEMEVSDATVRRDLKALADEQGLRLVHGGAALPRERDFSFQARLMRHVDEKKVIGNLASKLTPRRRPCVPRLRHHLLGACAVREKDARNHDPYQQCSPGAGA